MLLFSPTTIKDVPDEGMRNKSNVKGHLYVKFNIIFPQQLAEEKRS